jgi:hypothetical protein
MFLKYYTCGEHIHNAVQIRYKIQVSHPAFVEVQLAVVIYPISKILPLVELTGPTPKVSKFSGFGSVRNCRLIRFRMLHPKAM